MKTIYTGEMKTIYTVDELVALLEERIKEYPHTFLVSDAYAYLTGHCPDEPILECTSAINQLVWADKIHYFYR